MMCEKLYKEAELGCYPTNLCEDAAAEAYTFLKVNDGMQIGNSLFDEARSAIGCHFDGNLFIRVGHKGRVKILVSEVFWLMFFVV